MSVPPLHPFVLERGKRLFNTVVRYHAPGSMLLRPLTGQAAELRLHMRVKEMP